MKNSLQSSVEEKGKVVNQIIGFADGDKKTFKGVITDTIEQSEFTRFDTVEGKRCYVNTKRVNWFEVMEK